MQEQLLDLKRRRLHDHTPALLNYAFVPFDYDSDAPEPVHHPSNLTMSNQFGLKPMLGKTLAIMSDARLGNSADAIVERILNITGEDGVSINREFKDHLEVKLGVRFLILSNELPKFKDASGAIANRFMVLTMTKSWADNPDLELEGRLKLELAGILNWSLVGLDRLTDNGKFTAPQSSLEAVAEIRDLASPVTPFVREKIIRDVNAEVLDAADVYAAWVAWCAEKRIHATDAHVFGAHLKAVVPELEKTHRRIKGKQVWGYRGIGLR